MSTRTSASCKNHRRRDAVSTCVVCGAPLCADCMISTPVGFKCAACVGGGAQAPRRPGGRGRVPAAPTTGRRWLIVAAGLTLLAVVAGYVASRQGGADSEVPGGASVDQQELAVGFPGAGGLRLGAALALPAQAKDGAVPAALIIPGGGLTNRNGVSAAGTGGTPDLFYQDLAQVLSETGVASLRYDKRGGSAVELPDGTTLTFDDMVEDAEAGLRFLHERKEVDPTRTVLIGHDEGGLIALRVAAANPPPGGVRAVVLLSTPGRPLVEVLAEDLVATAPSPEAGREQAGMLREVVTGLLTTGTLPPRDSLGPALSNFFFQDRVDYLRAIFSLDPVAEARKLVPVPVPVLIVWGTRETGIGENDSDLLAGALGAKAETLAGDGAGHTLRVLLSSPRPAPQRSLPFEEDHARMMRGTSEELDRRDTELLRRISTWVRNRLNQV